MDNKLITAGVAESLDAAKAARTLGDASKAAREALDALRAALPPDGSAARGPRPTPVPVTPRKKARRRARAARRANRSG